MDSLKSRLLRGSSSLSPKDLEAKKDTSLLFNRERGLHFQPTGFLSSLRTASLRDKKSTDAVNVVTDSISRSHGPEAAVTFHSIFSDLQQTNNSLTLSNIEAFTAPYVIDRHEIVLANSESPKKKFTDSMDRSSLTNSRTYISEKLTSRAESGLFVSPDPLEACEDRRFPEAYVHISGKKERTSLENGLKKSINFRADSSLSSSRSSTPL